MNSYKTQYFKIEELVHPDIIRQWGVQSWMFLDSRMLWTLDELRKMFGKCTCNNWSFSGQRIDSGLRPFDSVTGAQFSAHKMGKAFDLIFTDITAEDIRKIIKKDPKNDSFKYITRIEESIKGKEISWLHIDNFQTFKNEIVFLKL